MMKTNKEWLRATKPLKKKKSSLKIWLFSFLCPQQAVSVDKIPISKFLLEYFPQKQEEQRHKQLGYTDKLFTVRKFWRPYSAEV